jgi:putative phosphoesterase
MPEQHIVDRCRRIGVISDTHGYLHAGVYDAFQGADLIVHAGDIGEPSILEALATIAPVRAVRGNMDFGPWARGLPPTDLVVVDRLTLYVLHDLQRLDLDPAASGVRLVISGHTHRATVREKNRIVFLNPGSAAQPRRDRHPTVAIVTARKEALDTRFIELTAV